MRSAIARPHGRDQYYWLTAFLAARGLQTSTCRIVAVVIFGLGTIPVTMLGSAAGPKGQWSVFAAIAVGGCCVLMAAGWLRHRWPSRMTSAACVVIGSLCIGAACVIADDPVGGLLGATSFTLLAAYVAFFHTMRLLALTWTIGVITLAALAIRLAHSDVALAISSVVLIVLLNAFVVFACRTAIGLLGGADIHHDEIEPLTGLLNRDAFFLNTATLMASRSRDDDRYLVLVVVNIDSFSLLLDMAGGRGGDRARVAVGQALRENVRHNAVVAHVSDAEFLIADSFTELDPSPLVERLLGAIKNTPPRLSASIGVVSTPLRPLSGRPPQDVLDEVINIATAAMYQARQAGGHQARYVLRPRLTVLDDSDEPPEPSA